MPRVTITVPEKTPQPYRFQLDRQVVTLGRGAENDIVMDSGSVSVKHAEMRRIKGGYELHDLGSTNGIKQGGVRDEVIPLHSGATVKVGDVAFDFSLSEDEIEELNREKPAKIPLVTRDEKLPLPPRETRAYTEASGESGFFTTLVFLILASAAFVTGMAVRHQKETGNSFFNAIQTYWAAPSAAAPPAR